MYTALIFEESTAFRMSMKQMLVMRFPRMLVDEAKDGDEAVRKISSVSPDLIFMNFKHCVGTGLDITRRIKKLNSNAVIVVLASHDLPEYREAAYQSGASHFFAKESSSCEEIAALVESMMMAKGAAKP